MSKQKIMSNYRDLPSSLAHTTVCSNVKQFQIIKKTNNTRQTFSIVQQNVNQAQYFIDGL